MKNNLLKKDIEKIKRGEFGLFILPELEKDEIKQIILRDLANKYKKGIYISFESNMDEVNSFLKKNGLEKKLHIVAGKGENKPKKGESVFSEEMSLTEISLLLENLTKSEKHDFIVLDSPNLILNRYNLPKAAKFLNYLIDHSKLENLTGLG